MTIFQDVDGKAYHFFASEKCNHAVVLLNDDYTAHTNTERRIMIGESREALAVFRYSNKYYPFLPVVRVGQQIRRCTPLPIR